MIDLAEGGCIANLHILDARLDEWSNTIVINESALLSPLEGSWACKENFCFARLDSMTFILSDFWLYHPLTGDLNRSWHVLGS